MADESDRRTGWAGAGTLKLTPEHCGQPMTWAGSHTTWEGPNELEERRYECATCPAKLTASLIEYVPLPKPI
jgi:hypothetical protein